MIVRIPETSLFTDLGGEAILLNLGTGVYYALDEAGTRMWNALLPDGRPETAVAALRGEYEIEDSRLLEDLLGLIEELERAGLVTVDGTDSGPVLAS